MRRDFEITIENAKKETIIDQGVSSIHSVAAIEKVLKKNKQLLEEESEITIILYPQDDFIEEK